MAKKTRIHSPVTRVRLLLRGTHASTRISSLLRNNLLLKCVAIVIAVSTWAYVQIVTNRVEVTLNVPIHFIVGENYHAQAFITNTPIDTVTLQIVCTPYDRDRLRQEDFIVSIDIADESETVIPSYTLQIGQNVQYVGPGDSAGYHIVGIAPSHIRILIDRDSQKNVIVVPTLVGEPAAGYEVTSSNVFPTTVTIAGPERIIRDINYVSTEPLSIQGFTRTQRDKKRIEIVDRNVVNRGPATVEVTVGINAIPVERTFTRIPVNILGQPRWEGTITLAPEDITVTIQAPAPLIETLDVNAMTAFVDVRDLTSGRFDLPVRVTPPEGCSIVQIVPRTISVTVSRYTSE